MSFAADAAAVFQEHRDELGFVNEAQCREGDLYTVERNGRTVGAALCNHCVRKPQTTLYELAVLPEYRRQGIASELLRRIRRDTPHEKIVAKCPEDLAANEWYRAIGWTLADREDGKHRALNVWEYAVPRIDLMTTGRPDLTAIAERWGWLRGTRLDDLGRYEKRDVSPEFVDLHWEDPDPERLLEAAIEHRPKYVVAGDYDGSNYDEINARARQLRPYAENVIIVPHEPGEPERVPGWALIGYSTPTEYAGTDAPVWEYRNAENPVHILGGTFRQIREIVGYVGRDEVQSIDTNTMHRSATEFAKWWAGSPPHWNHVADVKNADSAAKAYENSIMNITYQLREKRIFSPEGIQ